MNSAVSEVNRLKEALKGITGSRDQLRQELQASGKQHKQSPVACGLYINAFPRLIDLLLTDRL